MTGHIDADAFLNVARPELATGDAAGLARVVLDRWRPKQICTLLTDEDPDVRRVAAVVLGLIGDTTTIDCLARALHDEDKQVNAMAEHALWSIWFRQGRPAAVRSFHEGMNLLAREQPQMAVARFRAAIDADPDFTEAWNQCAIAHFLLGQWRRSIECGRRALELMPCHFGAAAGLGHCYTHIGDLRMAQRWYRRALRINPHMPKIARGLRRLKARHEDAKDSSGQFEPLHV